MEYPAPLQRLIDELRRLPGIGPKSAQRIAFALLRGPRDDSDRLAEAITSLHDGIRTCRACHSFTDRELCGICADASRDPRVICVVEEPHDVIAVERARDYRGRYHVLHGSLSPVHGIGPDELRIDGLLDRVREERTEELILGMSPTVEGEATAAYLAQVVRPTGVRLTRIATGVPVGSDLDWADEVTLARALQGRRDY